MSKVVEFNFTTFFCTSSKIIECESYCCTNQIKSISKIWQRIKKTNRM